MFTFAFKHQRVANFRLGADVDCAIQCYCVASSHIPTVADYTPVNEVPNVVLRGGLAAAVLRGLAVDITGKVLLPDWYALPIVRHTLYEREGMKWI
jgi:hypothetical protein